MTSGSQAKCTARSRWSRSPAVGLAPVGVASWATVSGATRPTATEPARMTTTTETRRETRRIANLPWFLCGCHHGSREHARLPGAATLTGNEPDVQMPDAPAFGGSGSEQTGTHHAEGTWPAHP